MNRRATGWILAGLALALLQMMQRENGGWSFPVGEVTDSPVFRLRGVMQDVARNYQSPELLKEQIRVAGPCKMNYFHLHLTDDQAWSYHYGYYSHSREIQTMTADDSATGTASTTSGGAPAGHGGRAGAGRFDPQLPGCLCSKRQQKGARGQANGFDVWIHV